MLRTVRTKIRYGPCPSSYIPCFFGRGEGVQGVLTLFCSGAAQVVCHALRVEELREQLEVEEEDGDTQEEEVEVESGESESKRVRHVDDHGWSVKALRT